MPFSWKSETDDRVEEASHFFRGQDGGQPVGTPGPQRVPPRQLDAQRLPRQKSESNGAARVLLRSEGRRPEKTVMARWQLNSLVTYLRRLAVRNDGEIITLPD